MTLSRNGEVSTVALADFSTNPALNILVRPGDVISIEPRNHSVVVLGATGSNEQVPFDTPTAPLSNVLDQIGGLENCRASARRPAGWPNCSGSTLRPCPGEDILVVYRFDLTNPASFFTLTEFEVRMATSLHREQRYEENDAALDVISDAVLRPIQIGAALDGSD